MTDKTGNYGGDRGYQSMTDSTGKSGGDRGDPSMTDSTGKSLVVTEETTL